MEAYATVTEVRERAARIGALTAGERNAHRIPGFDLGNSPLEFTSARVRDRVICMTTTNGTRALRVADGAEHVFVAAFVNLSVTVQAIRDLLAQRAAHGGDAGHVDIICAGSEGQPSPEDSACALELAARLQGREGALDLESLRRSAPHAIRLKELGYEADAELALRIDAVPSLVRSRSGRCGTGTRAE